MVLCENSVALCYCKPFVYHHDSLFSHLTRPCVPHPFFGTSYSPCHSKWWNKPMTYIMLKSDHQMKRGPWNVISWLRVYLSWLECWSNSLDYYGLNCYLVFTFWVKNSVVYGISRSVWNNYIRMLLRASLVKVCMSDRVVGPKNYLLVSWSLSKMHMMFRLEGMLEIKSITILAHKSTVLRDYSHIILLFSNCLIYALNYVSFLFHL